MRRSLQSWTCDPVFSHLTGDNAIFVCLLFQIYFLNGLWSESFIVSWFVTPFLKETKEVS